MSFFLSIVLVFASCATSPRAGQVSADGPPDFSVLPAGANVYLWADVERARPLLDSFSMAGFKIKDASQVLDRTQTAVAALYPEESPQRFFLAARGKYPDTRAGISMSFSRNWKKVKSETGNRYWHSKGYGVGVAMGTELVFASSGDPFAPPSGSDPAPEGFEDFRRPCVLAGWLNNPDLPINRFMDGLGIPLQIPAQEFFFGIVRSTANLSFTEASLTDNAQWELVFGIRTASASQARSLVSLFSMARFFMMMGMDDGDEFSGEDSSFGPMELAALLFANVPEQNEDFLTLRIGPLDEKRIALLLTMFPVYSNLSNGLTE